MIAEDKDLTPAAASLSRAAPQEWEQFKAAFKRFADRKRDDIVYASLDELQKSQGRAQACHAVTQLLDDAGKAAERMSDRTVRPRN